MINQAVAAGVAIYLYLVILFLLWHTKWEIYYFAGHSITVGIYLISQAGPRSKDT